MENRKRQRLLIIGLIFSGSLFYGAFSTFLKTVGEDPAWKSWASGSAALVFLVFLMVYVRIMIRHSKSNP